MGANCTVVCGVTIGEYAFVGAGSVVTTSIKPYALIVGVPGKQVGWMSAYGERLEIPLSGDAEIRCQHTGDLYGLKGDTLSLVFE